MAENKVVRTRVAPSPTGNAHVGTARSALVSLAYARKHGGKFILRIDDTDMERNTAESEAGVFESLRWLGIDWDEGPDKGGDYGPYKQSEKVPRYKTLANELLNTGKAYRCFCTVEELEANRKKKMAEGVVSMSCGGDCRGLSAEESESRASAGRANTIRLRAPEGGAVSFEDLIVGPGERRNETIGDFIIIKSDGFPVYHFATVVDDHDMLITHIIRGLEHYENTFKQLLIFHALGFEPPEYAHVPLLLDTDKSKISKSKGAVYVGEYRDMGYLPESIVNFISLLGWSPPDENEIFSFDEYVKMLDITRFSKSNAIFETNKLDFLNGHYIRLRTPENLLELTTPFLVSAGLATEEQIKSSAPEMLKLMELVRERMRKLSDVAESSRFYFTDLEPDAQELKKNKFLKNLDVPAITGVIRDVIEIMKKIEPWTKDVMEQEFTPYVEGSAIKKQSVMILIRTAAIGTPVSPPLFESMELLGKEKCLRTAARVLALFENCV